jgi:hypothetical protein
MAPRYAAASAALARRARGKGRVGQSVSARIIVGLGTSAAYPAAIAMVRRQARRLRTETPGGAMRRPRSRFSGT